MMGGIGKWVWSGMASMWVKEISNMHAIELAASSWQPVTGLEPGLQRVAVRSYVIGKHLTMLAAHLRRRMGLCDPLRSIP